MKIIVFFVLVFLPLFASADRLSDSNQLFDFTEKAYPEYFSPAAMPTYELDGYLVRHYPCCDNYIGTQARHATSRNSGTPVTLIRSPTQRMGYALNALRP